MKKRERSAGKEQKTGGNAGERKDRVLQTRVPGTLYADLVSRARRLRVPVSNLVRNILEDSTRMVENILEGSLEIAQTLGHGVSEKDLQSVLGWQAMSANRDLACCRCAEAIPKGRDAFASVGSPDGRTFVVCEACRNGI